MMDGLSGTSGVRDAGLLSPVWADSAAEAATGDAAFVRHMLDAEAALSDRLAAPPRPPPRWPPGSVPTPPGCGRTST
ncbi:hypothetical protein ABGB17_38205 [Sphaerisporangium sp. B11E5]|uniref:hypothetical protein n=1 Tax=Sphaerisporangium sp. B11E5 TaxID=3153563 RepID=UPI00325F12AB